MRNKIFALMMSLSVILSLTGCGLGNRTTTNETPVIIGLDEETEEGPLLKVETKTYGSTGTGQTAENKYTNLQKGDEIYNGFQSTIKVKAVNDDKIVLSFDGCLTEQNENGTINLKGDSLKEVTLKKGEEIKVVSKTMDAGVKITLEWK